MRALDELYDRRPDWLSGGANWTEGGVSRSEARFLLHRIAAVRPRVVVEIGTASGLSAAAMALAARKVVTYDIDPRYYADQARRTGDAAREMLPAHVLKRITFRTPATAIDVPKEFRPQTITLAFIDARHRHPWPALDLLAILPALAPGAEVVLHDINLPLVARDWPVWGAKWLFDELPEPKRFDQDRDPPNIGSIQIPGDKESLQHRVVEIVRAHRWEIDVPDTITGPLLAE